MYLKIFILELFDLLDDVIFIDEGLKNWFNYIKIMYILVKWYYFFVCNLIVINFIKILWENIENFKCLLILEIKCFGVIYVLGGWLMM